MGNIIVGLFLAVIIFFAVKSSTKHLKGEGGCCKGSVPKPKKKLGAAKITQKRIYIEGMHCENCKNRVEECLNQIEGAVSKVNLKKNTAVVSMSQIIEDEELRKAVEKANFKVIEIEKLI